MNLKFEFKVGFDSKSIIFKIAFVRICIDDSVKNNHVSNLKINSTIFY